MIRSVRVAAVQLRAHDRDAFEHRLDRIFDDVRTAAGASDLVVLPEATFPAYVIGRSEIELNTVESALVRLRELAASTRTVIVVGAVALSDSVARNAAFVIDSDGSLAGRTDKIFLWHFDRQWFTAGTSLVPWTTSLGVLGVLVCADGRLPSIGRTLVDRGAEAIVMPTAWVTSGRNPDALENVQADLLARVRAYENGVPFVAANKCGSERGMVAYCGKSQIVDRNGDVTAIASERQPQILRASIVLGAGRAHRASEFHPPPATKISRPLRVAISFDPLPQDVDERLALLEDDAALSRDEQRGLPAGDALPAPRVGDDLVLDPGGLIQFRRAGYGLVCWTSRLGAPWCERLARARALELRLYVVVFDDSARRAFAVDPDGNVVAGTFGEYRLASFPLDPNKVSQTLVAPGTDIAEGLERVARIAGAQDESR